MIRILQALIKRLFTGMRQALGLAATAWMLLLADPAAAQSLADIKISGLTVSSIGFNANGTWAIHASYTVMNVGTQATSAGWRDMGFLSTNGVLDNNSISDGSYMYGAPSLAAGASYNASVTFVTPAGVAPGTYSFFMKADAHNPHLSGATTTITDNGDIAESNETNNAMSVPVTLSKPDLKISGLTVSSIGYNTNGSWSVHASYTVTNVGTQATPSAGWRDMGFLSTNGVLDNNAISDGSYMYGAPALAAGASYNANVTFVTPAGVAPGTYSFFMKADAHNPHLSGASTTITDGGDIPESDETNNAMAVSVTLAKPDLKISGLTVSSIGYNANGSWSVHASYTVTNVGTQATPSAGWRDMGFLSTNGALDNNSISDGSYMYGAPALAAGGSYNANVTFVTPSGVTPGTYSFFMKADAHNPHLSGASTTITDGGDIPESDETNNAMSVSVTLAKPDLKISALSVSSVTANADGSWSIHAGYTVTNIGAQSTTYGWRDMGFLSTNGVLDNNSTSDGSYMYGAPALAAGASYNANVTFVTPAGVTPGTYSFFMKADAHNPHLSGASTTITDGGDILESDETNNAMALSVTLAKPDLKISGLTLNSAAPYANDSSRWVINASYTVTNVGGLAATGGWTDMGFLSTNGVLDNNAISDRYFLYGAGSLAPGASYTQTVTFVTPVGVTPGNYSFFIKTDSHNPGYNGGAATITDSGGVAESDETNNAMSVAVSLTRPDLKISGLTVNSVATYANDTSRWVINASYTVTNVGTATAVSGWTDMGFLSSNGVLDSNSISDRYFLYGSGPLAAGASYTQTVSFLTPAGVAPGSYSFFIKTDSHNPGYNGGSASITDSGGIIESDETNNAMSSPVTLSRPDLKISGMTVGSVTPRQDGTWAIMATYTVTNVGTATATGSWTDMGFLSSNGVLDVNSQSDNYFLYGTGNLAPGARYTQTVPFIVKSTTAPGSYTFFIKADAHNPGYNGSGVSITDNGSIVETDETNNAMSAAVALKRPDLTVTALSLGKVTLSDGTYKIPVAYTVKNIGTGDAPTGWTDMGYLSTNGVLDNNSLTNNYFLYGAPSLAAGATYSYSTVFTTLSTTQPGNYTFFLKADGHNAGYNGAPATNTDGGTWVETNEANNTLSSPVYLPIGTTTTMTSSVNPVKTGASTTLRATVSPSNATGSVSFYQSFIYGLGLIGTAPVNGGVATLPASFNLIGQSQALVAIYSGDSVYYTSTSQQVSQAVIAGDGAATLTTSAGTIVAGRPLTLTATLPSAATGTITFKDGSTTIGQVTLTAGKASMSTMSLTTAGTHALTAAYSGDANFASGTSNTVNEAVTAIVKANTTTAFQATPAFVVTGGSVNVAVTVTGSIPAGNVAILDGATTLATLPVTSGHANASVPLATVGSHALSAQYAGDDYNNASSSPSVSIQVNESSASSPGLMTWIYGYDARGNRWIDIDPNGHETDRNYDTLDRPFQILSPFYTGTSGARSVLGINYDGQDRVSSVLDPLNLTTGYVLDGLGNLSQLSSPDTGTATATFDADGHVLTRTDSRGKTTTYAYDGLGRLTRATYASGTATIYTYDGGTSPAPNSVGHLTLETDESGSTGFTYDFRGNVVQKVQVISGKSLTTSYTWGNLSSATGQLTSITYPSGTRVNYIYDTAGRVNAVTLNPTNANGVGTNTSTTIGLISGVTYNGTGAVTGWTWSDNVPYRRTFDGFGRLTSYPLGNPSGAGISAGLTRTLVYDDAARILGYTHANSTGSQASFDQQFSYDTQDRLTSQTLSTTSYGYTYDANGNRTTSKIGSTTYADSVAATSNRLNSAQGATGTQSFTYDNAGNTLTDGVATYTYSARGRMAAANVGGSAINYWYDGFEHRVAKTGPTGYVPTGAAYYAYDEGGHVIGEYNASLSPIYETVYFGDLPIAVVKQTGTAANSSLATTTYNVYADQTATPRIVTRSSDDAIVWRWDSSEAFGSTGPNSNPGGLGSFAFNQRFPGQIFDVETGNYYNWHRDYKPDIGRYAESDPTGLSGGANPYAYTQGHPNLTIDPTGLVEGIAPGTACAICHTPTVSPPPPVGGLPSVLNKELSPRETIEKAKNSSSVKEFCDKCKAHQSRAGARIAAHIWAEFSPESGITKGWKGNFNPPGGPDFWKTPVWADFKNNNFADSDVFKTSGENGGWVEEHPFGHPDLPAGKDGKGQNHDCPHFVAHNPKLGDQEFPYAP